MSKKIKGTGNNLFNEQSSYSKETKALNEFKVRVQDLIRPQHDDIYLQKWLKARSFDVDKAEKMFRDSMAFRDKIGADNIIKDYTPPEVLQKYSTGGTCGYDKDGSPVRVECYGKLDMRGLMYSAKKSDIVKSKILQNEKIVRDMERRTKLTGKRVDNVTVLFDMTHAGSKHFWRPGLKMYLHLVKLLEDNYPEIMKRLFIVNAPKIFPILWKLSSPLVSEDMKSKIHVLGSDYQQVLLQYIDADNLPKFLGGTLTDPDGDPMCRTMIKHGGTVPEEYYLSGINQTEGMETVTVNRGQRLKFDIEVETPGTVLRWEFRTDDYDIGFGVVHIINGKETAIVPVKRIDCHHMVQDGDIECEQSGTYAIIFDNQYSWSRGKTLHYLIELHNTDDDNNTDVDRISGGSWTRLIDGMLVTHM